MSRADASLPAARSGTGATPSEVSVQRARSDARTTSRTSPPTARRTSPTTSPTTSRNPPAPDAQLSWQETSPYAGAFLVAVAIAGVAVAVALVLDLPLRDPDGLLGPSYVRLPLIASVLLALDVLPRALWRTRWGRGLPTAVRDVLRERWPWRRFSMALLGLTSFYLTYVAYRNLKSFLPFVREDVLHDEWLAMTDLWFGFGQPPAELLHAVLGTGFAAGVLSAVYLAYLTFVPVSLAVALVAHVDARRSAFYVSALCFNWVLGTVSYYMLPSLGPIYSDPSLFVDLPTTGVSALQESLWRARIDVLADPWGTGRVHGIAAFGSLHTSVVLTAALVAQMLGMRRPLRWALWAFFVLTVLSTVYFGWHFVLDDVAGVVIALASICGAYLATRPVLGPAAREPGSAGPRGDGDPDPEPAPEPETRLAAAA